MVVAWRRKRVHRAKAIGAMPIGAPGCPEFAFWTASIDSVRIVLTARRSRASGARAMAIAVLRGVSVRWGGSEPRASLRIVVPSAWTAGQRHVNGPPAAILGRVPNRLAVPSHLPRRPRRRRRLGVRALVLGDLTLDVVLSPAQPLASGTDVAGLVRLRQGGSAA